MPTNPPGRLTQVAQAPVEGGECSWTFPSVPSGRWWTGALNVPGAAATAVLYAQIGSPAGGTPWGAWNGPGGFGPVQALSGETLTIFGFGLAQPAGTILAAWWQGVDSAAGAVGYVWPAPVAVSGSVQPVGATTYAGLDAGFATYAKLDAAFSTYGDVARYRALA